MKSRWWRYILAMLLSVASAAAYIQLETDDEACFPDGSFTFRAWNGKPGQLFTKDVRIQVWHPGTGSKFMPQGDWSEEVIWFTIYDPERKFSTYTSLPGTLNMSGDYRITLEYEGCRDGLRCVEHVNLDSCPGLRYDCKATDLKVTSCVVRENEAIIQLKAPKASYASLIRPYKDLNFYLKSNFQDLDGVDRIPGLIIERTGNTTFRMTVPLRDDEIIGAAAVSLKACDSPATPQKLVPCERHAPSPTAEGTQEPPRPAPIVAEIRQEKATAAPQEASPPQAMPSEEKQAPSLIIPMHLIVLALAVAFGIAVIIRSSRPPHRKVRHEEE